MRRGDIAGGMFGGNATLALRDDEEDQCCRSTLECYDFSANVEKTESNGQTYIKDLEDWKKVVCCMFEYWEPKDWCTDPDTEFPIYWVSFVRASCTFMSSRLFRSLEKLQNLLGVWSSTLICALGETTPV